MSAGITEDEIDSHRSFKIQGGSGWLSWSDQYSLAVCVDNKPLEVFPVNHFPNIIPRLGSEYTIQFRNDSDAPVCVEAYVDGVDVTPGFFYPVKPGGLKVIEGFLHGKKKALFSFADTSNGPSSSSHGGLPSMSALADAQKELNIGLIAVRVYSGTCTGRYTAAEAAEAQRKLGATFADVDPNVQTANPKKLDVATAPTRELPSNYSIAAGAESWRCGDRLATLFIRYNALGKVANAEMEDDFLVS